MGILESGYTPTRLIVKYVEGVRDIELAPATGDDFLRASYAVPHHRRRKWIDLETGEALYGYEFSIEEQAREDPASWPLAKNGEANDERCQLMWAEDGNFYYVDPEQCEVDDRLSAFERGIDFVRALLPRP